MPLIQKVHYTHDALIDIILANPAISQREMAMEFGYTESWMSIIINSDAFQQRLKERKAELIDPKIRASIEERVDALAKRALDKLLDRVEGKDGRSMKDADLIAAAKLGVGNRNAPPQQPAVSNNLYVVQIPAPAQTAQEWMATRSTPGGSQEVTQNPAGVYSVGGK